MGEAKRRKQMYGQRSVLNIGCFISGCDVSDAHAVYLGIGSRESKETYRISSHACIFEAWKILRFCQDILSDFKFNSVSGDEIIREFKTDLYNKYGDYPKDDAVYKIVGDKNFIDKLLRAKDPHIIELLQTDRVFVNGDKLFDGEKLCDNFEEKKAANKTSVSVIKPPVRKKYKVFASILEEVTVIPYSYGNPDENCVFFIGKTPNEPISCSKRTRVNLFNNYVTAAVVADYANRRNSSYLTEEELERLIAASATLVALNRTSNTKIENLNSR